MCIYGQGAFDNTSYPTMEKAALDKGISPVAIRWIKAMLRTRRIAIKLGSESITFMATKGCPQGGVLSPLLWTLVMDDLLHLLHKEGVDAQGYADDLVVIIRGKYESVISDLMQNALNITNSWCRKKGLNINPKKTSIVPFTNRRKLNLKAPTIDGNITTISSESNT